MESSVSQQLVIGRISDPVHGYIEFTGLERLILDHPVAQRLRNIAQSGLTHYVFPEVRTSRLSHCLGTMHVASAFFTGCLKNSASDTRDAILESLMDVVHPEGDIAGIAVSPAQADERILQAHAYCPVDNKATIIIVEQALRLAALFHDLGHLPFSHDFEHALAGLRRTLSPTNHPVIFEFVSKLVDVPAGSRNSAIHERVGLGLSRLLLRDVVQRIRQHTVETEDPRYPLERGFTEAVANIAYRILQTPEKRPVEPADNGVENALLWLHSIIAGDLDADRCDYLLRDGRNYGFEFAPYNLGRLLDNIVVAGGLDQEGTVWRQRCSRWTTRAG